jgi:hypothetical protein
MRSPDVRRRASRSTPATVTVVSGDHFVVLPILFDAGVLLTDIRPRTLRDLIRELRKAGELSPRTIHHVYGDLHAP